MNGTRNIDPPLWRGSPNGRDTSLISSSSASSTLAPAPIHGPLVKWLRHRSFTASTVGSIPPRVTIMPAIRLRPISSPR